MSKGNKSRIIAFYGNHRHLTIIVVARDGIEQDKFIDAAKTLGAITQDKDVIEILNNDEAEYFREETLVEYRERMTRVLENAFSFVPKVKVVHESLAGFTGD